MALTNYLGQTLVCVLVFDGWAFGQWGRFGIAAQLVLVLAIWAAQLIVSPLWLRRFQFGPMEWLWRSLTYWERQPMRVARSAGGRTPGHAYVLVSATGDGSARSLDRRL